MMTTDEAVPIILDALEAGLRDDWHRAFNRLADVCAGEPANGYTAACALANVVARVAALGSTSSGRLVAEVTHLGGPVDSHHEQGVALVAAFIAAQGNGDSTGTMELFRRLLEADDAVAAGDFLTTLFEITVATIRAAPKDAA